MAVMREYSLAVCLMLTFGEGCKKYVTVIEQ